MVSSIKKKIPNNVFNNPPMIFSIKNIKKIKSKKISINYPKLIIKKKKKFLNHPPMVFSMKEKKSVTKKKRMKNKKIFHKVHDFVDNFLLAYDDNYQQKKYIKTKYIKKYIKNLLLYHFTPLHI